MGLIERTLSLRRKELGDAKSPSYTPILRQHNFQSPKRELGHRRRQSETLSYQQRQCQQEGFPRPATSGQELGCDPDAVGATPLPPFTFPPDQYPDDPESHSSRPLPRPAPRGATYHGWSSTNAQESDTNAVGVALGSPTAVHPQAPSLGRSYTADYVSGRMPRPHPPSRRPPAIPYAPFEDASRPQAKRQRSWRNFFQRRSSKRTALQIDTVQSPAILTALPDHCSTVQSPVDLNPTSPTIHRNLVRLEARAEADHWTFQSGERHKPRRTPSMVASSKPLPSPNQFSQPCSSENMVGTVEAGKRKDSPDLGAQNSLWRSPSTPQLNVNIPDHEMERYSVMFQKLLQPRQSILDRRRTKLEQVNVQDMSADRDGSRPLPQRALTTPSVRTPVPIRLETHHGHPFERANLADRRASPGLQRSKTTPIKSPVRMDSGINMSPSYDLNKALPLLQPHSPAIDEESLPPTPRTCDDADSFLAAHASFPPTPNKQYQTKELPQLKFQSPNSPHEQGLSPKVRSPQELEKRMVQVSVARQVSVSRARRQVQHAVRNQQHIQPLRPTVIEVSKDSALRKSTVVVVEEA